VMAEQIPLDLPVRAATGRDDFFVAPANALALRQIDDWRRWPGGRLTLTGPEGAGKSHLARVWAAESGARLLSAAALPEEPPGLRLAVEDVPAIAGDPVAERALFHLHNHVLAEGGRLLFTGVGAPARWGIVLPDLASRLIASPVARLEPPDDALLAAVLIKLFADRRIVPPARLVAFLVRRMDRSFAAAGRLVARLDAAALASGRPIGRKLAAELLDAEAPDGR